jgi:hypothetical protein
MFFYLGIWELWVATRLSELLECCMGNAWWNIRKRHWQGDMKLVSWLCLHVELRLTELHNPHNPLLNPFQTKQSISGYHLCGKEEEWCLKVREARPKVSRQVENSVVVWMKRLPIWLVNCPLCVSAYRCCLLDYMSPSNPNPIAHLSVSTLRRWCQYLIDKDTKLASFSAWVCQMEHHGSSWWNFLWSIKCSGNSYS